MAFAAAARTTTANRGLYPSFAAAGLAATGVNEKECVFFSGGGCVMEDGPMINCDRGAGHRCGKCGEYFHPRCAMRAYGDDHEEENWCGCGKQRVDALAGIAAAAAAAGGDEDDGGFFSPNAGADATGGDGGGDGGGDDGGDDDDVIATTSKKSGGTRAGAGRKRLSPEVVAAREAERKEKAEKRLQEAAERDRQKKNAEQQKEAAKVAKAAAAADKEEETTAHNMEFSRRRWVCDVRLKIDVDFRRGDGTNNKTLWDVIARDFNTSFSDETKTAAVLKRVFDHARHQNRAYCNAVHALQKRCVHAHTTATCFMRTSRFLSFSFLVVF